MSSAAPFRSEGIEIAYVDEGEGEAVVPLGPHGLDGGRGDPGIRPQ